MSQTPTPSELIEIRRVKAMIAGATYNTDCFIGPQGPAGPGVTPLYGSFISTTSQPVVAVTSNPNSVAITYDLRVAGTIDVLGGTYPNSQIVIPVTGTYRVLFSAQCDSTSGKHSIEIFPVINGVSVANSNTRQVVDTDIEACLTVEYFLDFTANDKLQLYMTGDNTAGATNARLLYAASVAAIPLTGPTIPAVPSIIITIQRIE